MKLHVSKLGVIGANWRPGDAGYDLTYRGPEVILRHGCPTLLGLGVHTEFDSNYVAIIHDRSGMGAQGIHVLGGVIDSSYRGEWKVILINLAYEPIVIQSGQRIAQVLFHLIPEVSEIVQSNLAPSGRGHGGFGSTGK